MSDTNFTGSVPEYYDKGLGPCLFEFYARNITKKVVGYNPGSVVELAAGTGIVSERLSAGLPSGCSLIATDLNLPMLEIAKARMPESATVEFREADAQELPFPDCTFDAAVCQFGIMFFPDKAKSMREAWRVLNHGGHYVFNVWHSWAENPFAQLVHQTVAGFFQGEAPGFYKVPFSYHDVDTISATLVEAGFVDVEAEIVPRKSPIDNLHLFAKSLIFGNPIHDQILDLGGDPDAVVAVLQREITQVIEGDGTMPLKAILFTAKKPEL
ncbi:class I SAM-dependent methyltransferase [Paremcibacter congregatus]|uniref:Ubiquinone biosynthesis protein UbiE n=1 Tax=Paremcibacter congregatus TaxID=2043170 RepID=A0A2G4YMD9_9PROT|nr:methyltransferase domain-containing protein [Paremcibacter congregatus]PHZ83482.1 ubiquinone biosynthesis protein UbiE [Paremcibacter congregatus]QDE28051.1 methyltransferase domain-containing protein [Paremcibacter congregatus]